MTTSERPRDRAWTQAFPVSLSIVLFCLAGLVLAYTYGGHFGPVHLGIDITHYLDATHRWRQTGTPYLPSEVAGPYLFQPSTFLHPPISLYFFLPFTVLPIVLWWAIPIGILVSCLWWWRPNRWAWPVIALCAAWPRTAGMLIVGNTDMWVAAFLALGLRFGWPALLVAAKPSFAPFMLAGLRTRSWWVGLPIVFAAGLPFGTLWFDWLAVVRNAPMGLEYSLLNVPLLFIPIIAWRWRSQRPRSLRLRAPLAGLAAVMANFVPRGDAIHKADPERGGQAPPVPTTD